MPIHLDPARRKEILNTPREDLQAMLRIRQYLQEAQDWAKESGVASDPVGFDAADPASPASVTPMIDASAERTDAIIRNLGEQLETSEAK